MSQRTGGTKRSSWLTFRRRLLIVRTLLRGPATKDQLIATVGAEMGDQGYPGDAESALKHDLDSLKAEYGCRISFRRGPRQYVLLDLGELALLDLPDGPFEALNLLDASYPPEAGRPEQSHFRGLIDRVLLLLPPYRRKQYRERRRRAAADSPEGAPQPYTLRYRIAPAARQAHDLAGPFPNARVSDMPDGSALVSVGVDDLRQARQALLGYGDACEVLEPPELVELFRASARGLSRIYLGRKSPRS